MIFACSTAWITVNPIFLATFADIWIVGRSHPLKGEHNHVGDFVICSIKMTPSRCFLVFGQDVAPMLVEAILSYPM